MRYRKPEELKECGIEWIGKIPKDWSLSKLKFLSDVNSSNVDKKSKEGEVSVELCNYTDVYYNEFITNELEFMKATASDKDIERFQLIEGDVIITKDSESQDDIAVPTFVKETKENLLCGYHLALIRSDKNVLNGKYLFRLFQSKKYREEFGNRSNGITRYGLGVHELKNIPIHIPSLIEQRSIATFLDRKTEAIDQLIQKKEQLIERLKEKRQALITQAVTKGLKSDVAVKDSGIEWLGEIPEHWEVTKMKWMVSKIGSGKTPRGGSEVYKDEGIPFLRSQNIHFDGLRLDDVVYIDDEIHKDMSSTAIKPNDVLLNITGASIGRSSLVPKDFTEANLNQHVCILRPRKENVSPDFLHLVVSSDLVQNQIFAFENGTSREGLNFSQVGSLLVSLPPLEEQKSIVRKVREYEERIFSLSADIEEQIEKLIEYRQSLISVAVTGKIDVQDEVEFQEEKQNSQTANVYFKRRVLATKILDDLHQEPTMGRRKLQKILYLLEKEIETVELKGKYQKDAAGPFDNVMMRSIEYQLEDNEWFKRVERENGYGYKYIPMIKKDEYKKYYKRYWGNINSEIEELLERLRPEKTDLLSLVATLYACWNDFLIKEEEFDGKKLINESRYNWHEEKKEIPYKDWVDALNWMVDNGLEPQGIGELTKEKN